jgi:hypothetical protein
LDPVRCETLKGVSAGNGARQSSGDRNSKVHATRVATVGRAVKHARGVAAKVATSQTAKDP